VGIQFSDWREFLEYSVRQYRRLYPDDPRPDALLRPALQSVWIREGLIVRTACGHRLAPQLLGCPVPGDAEILQDLQVA